MANSTRMLILLPILWGVISSAVAEPTTLNDKVVQFCKDHRGQKVGDGECSSLTDAALKQAGAKARTAFKESPNKGDFVWGESVSVLEVIDKTLKETKGPDEHIQPGDVIQFRDAKFEGKNLRGFQNYDCNCPHHTAVVLAVKKEKSVITVLEQNVEGKKMVVESTYRLSDLKAGWLRIYRPVPE